MLQHSTSQAIVLGPGATTTFTLPSSRASPRTLRLDTPALAELAAARILCALKADIVHEAPVAT